MKDFFEYVFQVYSNFASYLLNIQENAKNFYTLAVRWILPFLAVMIFLRCILSLLRNRKQDTVWGYLQMPDNSRIPLMHWENSIGRSKLSDVVINMPFISRSHAVLTFYNGTWTIADLGSKGGIKVNGENIEQSGKVETGDVISLAGYDLTLLPPDKEFQQSPRRKVFTNISGPGKQFNPRMTLTLIIIFQILGAIQLCIAKGADIIPEVPYTFLIFIIAECLHYSIFGRIYGKNSEFELMAYFLCGIGLFVVTVSSPDSLYKQLAAIIAGICAFTVTAVIIKNLGRARILKYVSVICALLLLALILAIGETRNGAKNWIDLGFITFQPLEFVKIAFVLAGSATLDKLLTTRNLTSFIGFSGACIGTLAITKDFGTALVFFGTFIVIAFMRSGDIRTIALISAGAVIGAVAVLAFMPYVASRFEAWGHVWEYASTSGYQQTRTMVYAASGGLLGTGGGNGYLSNIAAAGTDLVFGVICEEWGLIIALTAVLTIVFLTFFSANSVGRCRSSFYAIAACGAATMFLIQTALNVFGSVDILPLTGVTFPFVSNGGTSMITSWCLLAFIKSADERCETVIKPDDIDLEESGE